MSNPIVDRVRLLMEYDLKKTSSENLSVITEKANLGAILARTSKSVVDDALRAGGITTTKGVVLKNTDELINALSKNLVGPASAGKLRFNLLRNPQLAKSTRTKLIDDMVADTKVASRYVNKTEEQITQAFVTKAGFTDDVANEIAKKIVAKNNVGKIVPKRVPTKPRVRRVKVTRPVPEGTYGGITQNIWIKAKDVIKKVGTWTKFLAWAIGLGLTAAAAYFIWKWFTNTEPEDEDGKPVPKPKTENKYRDCAGKEVLSFGCKSSDVRRLQGCIGVEVDGAWGPKTQARMVQLGLGQGISVTDIDQICKTQDQAEEDAQIRVQDTRNPRVSGREAELDVSSTQTGINVDATVSTGSVDDFS